MNSKNSFYIIWFYTISLVFSLLLTGLNSYAESHQTEQKWSFSFDNCTLVEALKQIEQATHSEIILKGEANITLNRVFTNQSISEIIRNIFRDHNFVMATLPGNNGNTVIKIQLTGKGKPSASAAASSHIPPPPPKIQNLQSPPSPPGIPMPGN